MRRATIAFAVVSIALGIAILVRTAVAGGGATAFGYIFGLGFVAAGVGRLYLVTRRA